MIKKRVAVIGPKGSNLNQSITCLELAGYDAFIYDPYTPPTFSEDILRKCHFIIVKGHNADFRFMMKLRGASKAKIINHWVGSDVNKTIGNGRRWMQVLLTQLFINQNWVVGERLVRPLKSLGIASRVVPHVIFHRKELKPKLQTKGILVYNPPSTPMPKDPGIFYGIDKAVELSTKLPDYTFHLVGGGKVPPGFVLYVTNGYLHGLDGIWDKVDFYLRVTINDGMPRMILEAAENGIITISNYPYFDGIIPFTGLDDVVSRIKSMTDQQYRDTLDALTKDIMKTYSLDAVVNAYRSNLDFRI